MSALRTVFIYYDFTRALSLFFFPQRMSWYCNIYRSLRNKLSFTIYIFCFFEKRAMSAAHCSWVAINLLHYPFLQGRNPRNFLVINTIDTLAFSLRAVGGETRNYTSNRQPNFGVPRENARVTRGDITFAERYNRRATVRINSNDSLHRKTAREYSSDSAWITVPLVLSRHVSATTPATRDERGLGRRFVYTAIFQKEEFRKRRNFLKLLELSYDTNIYLFFFLIH